VRFRTILILLGAVAVLLLGPVRAGAGRTVAVHFGCGAFTYASTERVQNVGCEGRPWKRFRADAHGPERYVLKISGARVRMRLDTVRDDSGSGPPTPESHVHGTWKFTRGTRRLSGIHGSGTVRGTVGGPDSRLVFVGTCTARCG
jgi:hypothetical protein